MRPLAVIIVASCLGCATAALEFTPTGEAPRPLQARPADQVEVFLDAPPERAHVEVGVIEAQQEPGSTDQAPELIAKMQVVAGKHGCDGLANFDSNDTVTETMMAPGGGTRKYALSGYRASCIVYVGPGPSAKAAVQPSAPDRPSGAAQSPDPIQSSGASQAPGSVQPAPPVEPTAREQSTVCAPNATQLCYGPGGCRGGQSCTADGRGWTPCDCGTAAPPAAADR